MTMSRLRNEKDDGREPDNSIFRQFYRTKGQPGDVRDRAQKTPTTAETQPLTIILAPHLICWRVTASPRVRSPPLAMLRILRLTTV
jgi:hypothetical protein